MGNGIHEEGDMLHAGPTKSPGDKETCEGLAPCSRHQRRQSHRDERVPHRAGKVVQPHQRPQTVQHTNVVLAGDEETLGGKEPADVRKPKPIASVVRVLRCVASTVMKCMRQGPAYDGTLISHGVHEQEDHLQSVAGSVGLVRPETVSSSCDPKTTNRPQQVCQKVRLPADGSTDAEQHAVGCQDVPERNADRLQQSPLLSQVVQVPPKTVYRCGRP
mmetsp:Transcript_59596/g.128999  ORF Transcript_59596/g.128999 Transcript_59596/m.128999 type:complete len:217 (+) Transcript_59596:529-1179(+)